MRIKSYLLRRLKMRIKSYLLLIAMYLGLMMFIVCGMLTNIHAEEFMKHEDIMDGFVHAQKAPQMGKPMIYLPSKKLFKGKRHKKGHPHGEQRFGRKHLPGNPTPVPSSTPSPAPSPVASGTLGGNGPGGANGVIITDGFVDLRSRDSPIKDQIGPICTAYAGNAGIENLLGKGAPDFSEEYTFSLYGRYSVDSFSRIVPGKKLALNSMWPRGGNRKNPFSTTEHMLVTISYIGDGEIENAKTSLKQGHPVYFGLEVPADMSSCLASIRPTTRVTSGGHAVLIVGFKDDMSNSALGGGYFIIKNSWTAGCGDKGFQYLPYSYCNKSYCYFYDMAKVE